MEEENKPKFDIKLLFVTTLLISICSIIYELLISAISSYIQGDSITQFSITIGLYMSAMGVGSYLSKHVKNKLFNKFVFIEMSIGILGGLSTLILFVTNIYTEIYPLVMYSLIIAIGVFVGLEIPILTRIIENNHSDVRKNLANIFTFDYIGGLVGSIAFPLFLFPKLGFITTALLVGLINITTAMLIIIRYRAHIAHAKRVLAISSVCFAIVLGLLCSANILTKQIESGLYRDDIILSEQTQYQKIVITKHKDDVRLFLDGNLQFSSMDEYRYHEALVHVPMMYAKSHRNVLILGGGDGLAARELLKYDDVEKIVLVDIDKDMTDLCKENNEIKKLNQGSLDDSRLTLINDDAYMYVQKTDEKFDVIIIDFPDPNNTTLNKLYTNVFYNYIKNILTPEGVMVCQSTSPYYAPKSFWCVNKTIKTQFENVIPYHIQVPSFGEWGYNMAFNGEHLRHDLKVDTRYLTSENIDSLFVFGKDESINIDEIKENNMFEPALITYYNAEVENW